MCTDVRLVQLADLHVSARTMDFAEELGSTLQVVPVGQQWSATRTHSDVETLRWTNAHGYVAMDAFGFDWAACDGVNDAGLSIGTLWFPEQRCQQPRPRPARRPRSISSISGLGSWGPARPYRTCVPPLRRAGVERAHQNAVARRPDHARHDQAAARLRLPDASGRT